MVLKYTLLIYVGISLTVWCQISEYFAFGGFGI